MLSVVSFTLVAFKGGFSLLFNPQPEASTVGLRWLVLVKNSRDLIKI